jgi:hypothetical protein
VKPTETHSDENQTARPDEYPAAWKARWKKAIEETAGIAPYLDEGADFVEDIRRKSAELS